MDYPYTTYSIKVSNGFPSGTKEITYHPSEKYTELEWDELSIDAKQHHLDDIGYSLALEDLSLEIEACD